ncbi:DNA topoisomerase IV [Boudabousia liubingyangii]|uniref:DNA topoisomerase (ATP-hydrolyzing) n=1 Tax=Boudabousia liubingyangii TaxID=1921764 RepID=A0A1Q5PJB4_9ACTO|nr:DNA topoisomerase IV subunit A [Boudabousia liubingyangii]OKL45980.1 DNA topoisomerase IV [Boudabousia liubingyangii]
MADKEQDSTIILDTDVSQEMEKSFLEYAYSVIYSRALPDARDGMKPVQRRIVYQMSQMGLRPDRGHVKSQRVVGDVMGKLHPHGDSAIYDALVRLAQDFSMRVPLVDGHGNFGSLDDGPAAPRYTEARMAAPALDLVADLDEDVVDFVPNYDNQFMQPAVLPAAFPNLLVNGASGIAVGMATNIAPHNLGEVCRAACYLLENPEASLEELMMYLPGPDLPTGGTIVGLEGIKEAYETGRGAFRTRAKAQIERISARKMGIVVTELPYLVGPERVIEKIKDVVNSGKVKGISAVTNLTDRHHGLRLVIEIKHGFNPDAVLASLYKHTPLEDSFSINAVALVDGQPRTMGVKEMLRVYLDHRLEVILRRTNFRLHKRLDRLHLVEGLLIAVLDIDDVIAVIRSSEDTATARVRLMDIFELSELQAEHILSLQLRRLTKLAQLELEAERDQLKDEIAQLQKLLDSQALRNELLVSELMEVAKRLDTPRRTILLADDGLEQLADIPLEVADSPCQVVLTPSGTLLRVEGEEPIPTDGERKTFDTLLSVLPTTNRAQIAVLDETGVAHKLDVLTIPSIPRSADSMSLAGGTDARLLVKTLTERPLALVSLAEDAAPLAVATSTGTVKRIRPEHPTSKETWEVITGLSKGETLKGAGYAPDDAELVFIADDAQLLRFSANLVRPQGINAGGMSGISLKSGASVVCFGVVPADKLETATILTATSGEGGLLGEDVPVVKVSPLSIYPPKGRSTQGVRAMRFLTGQNELSAAWLCPESPKAINQMGAAVALPDLSEKRDGSGTAIAEAIFHAG